MNKMEYYTEIKIIIESYKNMGKIAQHKIKLIYTTLQNNIHTDCN